MKTLITSGVFLFGGNVGRVASKTPPVWDDVGLVWLIVGGFAGMIAGIIMS